MSKNDEKQKAGEKVTATKPMLKKLAEYGIVKAPIKRPGQDDVVLIFGWELMDYRSSIAIIDEAAVTYELKESDVEEYRTCVFLVQCLKEGLCLEGNSMHEKIADLKSYLTNTEIMSIGTKLVEEYPKFVSFT